MGVLMVAILALTACGGGGGGGEPRAKAAANKKEIDNPLEGTWRRERTCAEYVSEMRQAGLADMISSHQELVHSDEFGGAGDSAKSSKDPNDLCAGVNGRLAHDHVFYKDGRFASVNENGEFVDEDTYKLPNDHTIVFPGSGSKSFPRVTAHFRFSDDRDTVTFDLVLPDMDECSQHCRGTYEWAVSVFYEGLPWKRVPPEDQWPGEV
jgi:hypothetical protein